MLGASVTLLLATLIAIPSLGCSGFDFSTQSEVLKTQTTGRIRGARNRQERDFILGGLFPIHASADVGGGACGLVRLERGLERMEAMLFTLDMINNDSTILPGLTLGYDIRDTCGSENVGLDETVDLVITSSQLDIESCSSNRVTRNDSTSADFMDAPTSVIVGAASSRVSVPVASLVRLFTTPQISYASSSAILSNRDRYGYFYRTIPPDNLQAEAMIDVMLRFNWTYISTIYSRNPYGTPGIDAVHSLAARKGICIDLDEGIDDSYTEEDFGKLAQRLEDSIANVVVLFTSQDNAEQLFRHIVNTTTIARRFTWIASDAWARSISVVHQFNATAAGLFGFAPLTDHLDSFESYFSSLTIDSNLRNPWFEEFYSAIANCTLNETLPNNEEKPVCNRSSSVTDVPRYEQGNFIPLVVDAVYTFAYALQNFLDENCDQPLQWFRNNRTCFNQSRKLDGQALLEYIQRVDFESITGNRVAFDANGNPEARYEILNYHAFKRDGKEMEYSFQRVAVWDSSFRNVSDKQALNMLPNTTLQFGLTEENEIIYNPSKSECGRCLPGQYRRTVQSSCCGVCEPCLGQNYSSILQASNCSLCADDMWGNNPLVGSDQCVKIDEFFLDFSHPYSVIIVIIAIIGLIGIVFTSVVFAKYWTTPIVKSSGREQMILLLIGITLSFISAFFYVSPPVVTICAFQRLFIWICFSMMFGALLVKIVRVARIFLRKTSVTRPRFTEPVYQVIFTFLIVSVQLLLLIIWFGVQPPEVVREKRFIADSHNEFPTIIVTCQLDVAAFVVLSVLYNTLIIGTCTILGLLSFSYPENFNEAKHVAFCSLSTLVIWIAFIITFGATRNVQEFQNIAISLAVVMTGYAVLFCMFGQRLFIILFQPKKNTAKFSQHGTSEPSAFSFTTTLSTGDKSGYPLTPTSPTLVSVTPSGKQESVGMQFVLPDTSQNEQGPLPTTVEADLNKGETQEQKSTNHAA